MSLAPANYQQVGATSGNVAAAIATASLPVVAGRTTYLTSFDLTGSGATAGAAVIVTITGLAIGTQSYIYTAATGATVGNTPLSIQFPNPLPASAVNTPIVITCPSLGAGNTNNVVNIRGYQL